MATTSYCSSCSTKTKKLEAGVVSIGKGRKVQKLICVVCKSEQFQEFSADPLKVKNARRMSLISSHGIHTSQINHSESALKVPLFTRPPEKLSKMVHWENFLVRNVRGIGTFLVLIGIALVLLSKRLGL